MLSEIQQNNFTTRAKEEANKLFKRLNITELTDIVLDNEEDLDFLNQLFF